MWGPLSGFSPLDMNQYLEFCIAIPLYKVQTTQSCLLIWVRSFVYSLDMIWIVGTTFVMFLSLLLYTLFVMLLFMRLHSRTLHDMLLVLHLLIFDGCNCSHHIWSGSFYWSHYLSSRIHHEVGLDRVGSKFGFCFIGPFTHQYQLVVSQ